MALREVLAQFDIQVKTDRLERAAAGIKGAEERLARFGEAVRRFQINGGERAWTSLRRMALGAVAVGYGLSKLVTGSIAAANQLRLTADELGVTTDELQRYEFAAEATGLKTKDVTLAFRYLERSMSGISAASQGSSKALTKLHIKATDATGKVRPLWEVLGDLSDKMQKDPGRAVGMAMSVLGRGGAAMVPILKQGRAGLDSLKEAFDATSMGLRGDFIEAAKRAQLDLTRLKFSFVAVRATIAQGLFPWLHKLADGMVHAGHVFGWLREHTYAFETALQFLGGMGAVLGILRIVKAVEMLGAAMGITFGEALLEILPIVALLGLLYLVFDDIYTWVNGGDSLIGRWLDGTYGPGASKRFLSEAKQLVKDVGDALEPVADAAKAAGRALLSAFTGGLPGAIRAIAGMIVMVSMAVDALVSGLGMAKHLLGAAWNKITGDDAAADEHMAQGEGQLSELEQRFQRYNDALGTLMGDRAPVGVNPKPGDDDFVGPAPAKKGTYGAKDFSGPPDPRTMPPEPPGARGAPGGPGHPGAPGHPGVPGNPGAPAAPGAPGLPGSPGSPGLPGSPGSPGAPGNPGRPGAPGNPGAPAAPPAPPPRPVQISITQHFTNDPGKPGDVKRATTQGVGAALREHDADYAGVAR